MNINPTCSRYTATDSPPAQKKEIIMAAGHGQKRNCPVCQSQTKEIKNNMGVLVAIILVALTAIIGWLLGDNDPRGKFLR